MIAAKISELRRAHVRCARIMTEWESNFCRSMLNNYDACKELNMQFDYTAKQWNRISELVEKYR